MNIPQIIPGHTEWIFNEDKVFSKFHYTDYKEAKISKNYMNHYGKYGSRKKEKVKYDPFNVTKNILRWKMDDKEFSLNENGEFLGWINFVKDGAVSKASYCHYTEAYKNEVNLTTLFS